MNPETRQLISWWKIQSSKQDDPFIEFFVMYMCLDAWMTAGSLSDSDAKKLKWLKESDNPLREYWKDTPKKTDYLQGLMKIGEVEDMRPNHRGEYRLLSDVDDFDQVIEFIYQIRCNLFHGGKSPVNANDRRLVTLASNFLTNWIEWTLIKTK